MGKTYRIAVIPGDGTGPEVTDQALKVLDAAARAGRLPDRAAGTSTSAATTTSRPARPCRTLRSRNCGGSTPSSSAPSGTPTSSPASWSRASCSGPLRAGPVHQPAARQALPGRGYPAQGQGPRGHRLRGGAGEHRGPLRRHRRLPAQGHARRGGGPGVDQHPQGRGALPALRLRVLPQARPGARSSPCAARPTCSPTPSTCGSAPSTRSGGSTPTSSATTPTWTPPACGW